MRVDRVLIDVGGVIRVRLIGARVDRGRELVARSLGLSKRLCDGRSGRGSHLVARVVSCGEGKVPASSCGLYIYMTALGLRDDGSRDR